VKERKNTPLFLIEQAQVISNFSKLRQDYSSILIASGLLELSQHLFKEGVQEEGAFSNLLASLEHLEKEGARRRVFWSFLIRNFEIMGWGLRLHSCEKCGKNFAEKNCLFDIIQGSGLCEHCGQVSAHTLLVPSNLSSWLCDPQSSCNFTSHEEALLQELLEKHYQHHLHMMPDWNRFLRVV